MTEGATAVATHPEEFELLQLVGAAEALAGSGKVEASLDLYERWLRRHAADPGRHFAQYNYGVLLYRAGRAADAIEIYEEAIQSAPDFLPAYINAGIALESIGRIDRAVDVWLRAAAHLVPTNKDFILQKTTALKQVGRVLKNAAAYQAAEAALRQSLDIDPRQRDTAQHWIALRQIQCRWPILSPEVPFGNAIDVSRLVSIMQPLSLAIHTDDPLLQLTTAWRHFNSDVMPAPGIYTAGRWPPPATHSARPLRIGYVSPDLREHAIGFLTAEVFALHDRSHVEIFAYNSGPTAPDAMQTRIRNCVDHWTDITGLTDKQTARRIVSDAIDILVDLGGHTSGAPTALFALRPAPIIVNWLGYPGSMGTPHHQYIIADNEIIPPAYEKYYSERVLRLPCYQPTDRKRIVAGPPPTRQEVGLPEAAIVYCCFNGTQKITSVMFAHWMAILARVPGSVLWLLSCDAATDSRLREQAEGYGIAADRMIFAARQANAQHLARFPLADLFLDTWPYGAHTTASDALWMGVPAITMTGHSFASRVCGSLVCAANLRELVCEDPQAYVRLAVDLGTQPEALFAVRNKLRAGRDDCTLFAMPHLVEKLESLYAQMWREYSSGQIPEPDLTNFEVYHEIGAELDHTTVVFPDLHSYERRYTDALIYRESRSPVPPDRRLWLKPR